MEYENTRNMSLEELNDEIIFGKYSDIERTVILLETLDGCFIGFKGEDTLKIKITETTLRIMNIGERLLEGFTEEITLSEGTYTETKATVFDKSKDISYRVWLKFEDNMVKVKLVSDLLDIARRPLVEVNLLSAIYRGRTGTSQLVGLSMEEFMRVTGKAPLSTYSACNVYIWENRLGIRMSVNDNEGFLIKENKLIEMGTSRDFIDVDINNTILLKNNREPVYSGIKTDILGISFDIYLKLVNNSILIGFRYMDMFIECSHKITLHIYGEKTAERGEIK